MQQYLIFCLAVLLLALSPGPNWAYLITRSIGQGYKAGIVSSLGILTAFLFYILLTAFGFSILFKTVPFLYWLLKIGGAGYLLWLAWQSVKPKGKSMFDKQILNKDNSWKLYRMGFLTNLLNPKTAVFYVAVFPLFLRSNAAMPAQTIVLGLTHIAISFTVHLMLVISASRVSKFLEGNTKLLVFQKWFTGSVLACLGIKMLLEKSN